MPTIWNIPNDLWEEFKLVLPPEKPARTVGRPAVPFRKVLNGILYVLRTGCQWKKVSKEFGSGSTFYCIPLLTMNQVEEGIERIWFWLNLPYKISGMG